MSEFGGGSFEDLHKAILAASTRQVHKMFDAGVIGKSMGKLDALGLGFAALTTTATICENMPADVKMLVMLLYIKFLANAWNMTTVDILQELVRQIKEDNDDKES